jgi:hypothetical protein
MSAKRHPLRAPRALFVLAMLAASVPGTAHADVMYSAAWVDCDTVANRLSVRYGLLSSAVTDPSATVFWSLIRYSKRPDGNPDQVTDLLPATSECRLKNGRYTVTLEPIPLNYNLQARCGGVVRGSVTIERDGRQILPPLEFAPGDCWSTAKVVRRVSVDGNDGKLLIEHAENE